MISLLISTHNRSQAVVETVQAWQPQLSPFDAEIIVVDYGSLPGHAAYLREHLAEFPRVQLIELKHGSLAVARNAAIDVARGNFLYFLRDDMRPGDDHTLHKALERAQETGQPVVGHIRVPPAYRETVIQHLWHQRTVSRTVKLADRHVLGPTGFSFAALIMPRDALHDQRFAPDFHGYGWEEHELGYRLYQRGVRAHFRNDLWYDHHDMVTFSGLLKKYEAQGVEAVTFSTLHPESRAAFLAGTAWLNRLLKTLLAYTPRGDRAVKKLAQQADDRFVGDPDALAVLERDLFIALEGAYFRGTLAELQDRKGA